MEKVKVALKEMLINRWVVSYLPEVIWGEKMQMLQKKKKKKKVTQPTVEKVHK